jgi:hypothetical protein
MLFIYLPVLHSFVDNYKNVADYMNNHQPCTQTIIQNTGFASPVSLPDPQFSHLI